MPDYGIMEAEADEIKQGKYDLVASQYSEPEVEAEEDNINEVFEGILHEITQIKSLLIDMLTPE